MPEIATKRPRQVRTRPVPALRQDMSHTTPEAASPLSLALFVGDWLPYSETFVYDQVAQQKRTKIRVYALSELAASRSSFPYANVHTLSKLDRVRHLLGVGASTHLQDLRSHNIRLIHAHFGTNGARSLHVAKALNLPLAVSYHGYDIGGLEKSNRFHPRYWRYQQLAKPMFDYASLFLCASQELAEILVQQHGVAPDKVVVHRLGIDLQRFQPCIRAEGPVRALMIGRLVEKKGMEYGLQAFANAKRDAPQIHLDIVGSGPRLQSLQQLANALGLSQSVTFHGSLKPDDVLGRLKQAHLLLAPSVVAADGDRESGVLVVKEAGATGLPVIGSRHGGIPEIIDDGETGFLVEERDVKTLTERLISLVSQPKLRAQLGQQAVAKMAAHYDTVVQNARLESLLCSLV